MYVFVHLCKVKWGLSGDLKWYSKYLNFQNTSHKAVFFQITVFILDQDSCP